MGLLSFKGKLISVENNVSLTPRVGKTVHLFTAPFIWTVIGAMLMIRGANWADISTAGWLMLVAFVAGTAKSIFVLDKAAAKTTQRILDFSSRKCLGAVYSWKTWLLVVLMMGSGIAMRMLTHPGMVIGTLYMAIGWALFLSSRLGWQVWLQQIRND
jgi:hypothetical protein